MIKLAVFASGTGSNFVNLVTHNDLKKYATIDLLVCDNPKAKVIEKAKALGVDTLVFNPNDYHSKQMYETMLLEVVGQYDYLILAGYMRIISYYFLENYKGKVINIHPSLLPLYKGIDSIKRAYDNKEEYIGVTIHYVNEKIDDGEIISQDKFAVDYTKNLDEVTQLVHALEHQLYPKTLIDVFKNKSWTK